MTVDPVKATEVSIVYFVSCRMEAQYCRKKNYYTIGFMDPDVINEHTVATEPKQVARIIYKALMAQHTCSFILLPYNFK